MDQLELNRKAMAEADMVTRPFAVARDDARLAYGLAEAEAGAVWREAYAYALKAPRNN